MIGCLEPNPPENSNRREFWGNFGGGVKIGDKSPVREMITRSKLVEQLRDYQIRSQNQCSALAIFSPKPHIASRWVFSSTLDFLMLFQIGVLLPWSCFGAKFSWIWNFVFIDHELLVWLLPPRSQILHCTCWNTPRVNEWQFYFRNVCLFANLETAFRNCCYTKFYWNSKKIVILLTYSLQKVPYTCIFIMSRGMVCYSKVGEEAYEAGFASIWDLFQVRTCLFMRNGLRTEFWLDVCAKEQL